MGAGEGAFGGASAGGQLQTVKWTEIALLNLKAHCYPVLVFDSPS